MVDSPTRDTLLNFGLDAFQILTHSLTRSYAGAAGGHKLGHRTFPDRWVLHKPGYCAVISEKLKSVIPNCRSPDLIHQFSCISSIKMVLGCVSCCWQATESITLRPLICISALRPRSWIKYSSRSHGEWKPFWFTLIEWTRSTASLSPSSATFFESRFPSFPLHWRP